jgi:hypothetical protein
MNFAARENFFRTWFSRTLFTLLRTVPVERRDHPWLMRKYVDFLQRSNLLIFYQEPTVMTFLSSRAVLQTRSLTLRLRSPSSRCTIRASNGFSARADQKPVDCGAGCPAASSAARLSSSASRLIFQNAFESGKPASGSLPSISGSSPASSPCNRLPPPHPRSLNKQPVLALEKLLSTRYRHRDDASGRKK